MTERIVPRGNVSPIVTALRLALEEIAERRRQESIETVDRRATLRVVRGGRRVAA